MDDNLSWERNMTSFPWNHNHQEIEESFIFGSENIFLNSIQELQDAGAGDHQMGLAPAPVKLDSVNVQYWCQPLTVNGFQEGKNVIPTTAAAMESLDCLLSATNSNGDTPPDHHGEGISVIFSDYKNLFNDNNHNNVGVANNNFSGCSSGGSVTKETENDVVSKQKTPTNTKRSKNANGLTTSFNHEDNPPNRKRPRSDPGRPASSNINFRQSSSESDEPDSEAIAQMKEMIYRAAAFRPVSFADDDVAEKPRRKNVRISNDPQTVAARQRRERISEKIRVLQKLVPGGNKMDTASMLDEAANYLKFLRSQVKALEQIGQKFDYVNSSCGGGTSSNARSTSHVFGNSIISNPNDDHARVVVGVPFNHNPFPMQTHLGNY